ncbi:MAG: MFS transporter [Bacilli bacterium]|nr:MFS transporter [Bacilli bacterium]
MKKRLSKKQMIIFALGQFGWSLLGGIISAWLVTFFLPTEGNVAEGAIRYILPGLAIGGFLTVIGLITALSRIFDAITDPLIASLSDRSKNKRGRRIPFMQIAAIPFAVVTVLLFCIDFGEYNSDLGWLNILWVSVMIVLFYLFMTMYCTPYNALISEFGQNQEDRMFISTSISFTYLFGTLFAYLPFVLAGPLRGVGLSYAWSYRVCFIALAVVALISMLLPTILLKETDFIDPKPSDENVFKSLVATFKNKDFRTFSFSDIMYWVGLTMFQTGLPYFVKVSMGFDEGFVIVFMGGMSILAAVFYPFVTNFVKKWGKKKLVITGFFGLAICYAVAAVASIPGVCPAEGAGADLFSWILGISIMIISALPMALLGIIPQSIVADVAEAEAKTTGQNREGMFFAARTFAMKFGQSLAMILFTSLAVSMSAASSGGTEVYPSKEGLIIVAIVAVTFCVAGAVILMFYREKKVMQTIAKEADKDFMRVVEQEKE